jgi:hypothetical protein
VNDNQMATTGNNDDSLTVFLERGSLGFGMMIDKNITLRSFTRAIQHSSMFGIRKRNLRLSVLQDDGTWIRFYSWRFRTDDDKIMYDKPVHKLGITDGTVFKVEYVLSGGDIAALAVACAVALPAAASASLTYYGAVSGGFLLGFVGAKVGLKAVYQRIYASATAMVLPRDMPAGILEIKRL